MVDCLCVWLYSTLGVQVMEKATTVLGSKCHSRCSYQCNFFSVVHPLVSDGDSSVTDDRIRFTAGTMFVLALGLLSLHVITYRINTCKWTVVLTKINVVSVSPKLILRLGAICFQGKNLSFSKLNVCCILLLVNFMHSCSYQCMEKLFKTNFNQCINKDFC